MLNFVSSWLLYKFSFTTCLFVKRKKRTGMCTYKNILEKKQCVFFYFNAQYQYIC